MTSKEQTQSVDKAGAKQKSPTPAMDGQTQQEAPLEDLVQRARFEPRSLSPRDVLQLQRIGGNQAVAQMLAGMNPPQPVIQAKLTVGAAGDKYEEEADRVASQVMRAPAPAAEIAQRQEEEDELQAKPLADSITPLVQRAVVPEEEELQAKFIQRAAAPEEEELQAKFVQRAAVPEEEELQAKSITDGASFTPGANFESSLASARSGGTPLPKTTRDFMEQRIGADFSRVKVHTDAQSDQLNQAIQAKAFTTGQDVFFRAGAYQPSSESGKELIAHELTHVVQQSGRVIRRANVSYRPATASYPIVQRAGADFGLKTKANTSSFVSDAVAFWKKTENKGKPLQDYATFLMNKVNTTLTANCPSQFIASGGDSGSFSRVTWSIKINTSKFSSKPATDTVGELTADEAAEVADTIYHEARHSEQYFTAAQIMAGEGSDEAAIIASLSIPADVAKQAFGKPIKADKKNKDMIATVKDWQNIGAGIHATYKGLVNGLLDETEEVRKDMLTVNASTLVAKTASLNTTISGWKSNQLVSFKSEVTRLDGMKNKSKGDNLVHSHAKKIVKLMQALVDAWEKDTTRSVATIRKLGAKARSLEAAVYAAYRDHLHEKDAWAVGGAAGAQFRKLAKKK